MTWNPVSFNDVADQYTELGQQLRLSPGNLDAELSASRINNTAFILISAPGRNPLAVKGQPDHLAATLYALADRIVSQPHPHPTERWQSKRDLEPIVQDLTPQQVIAYFQQSPVLRSMAADVEAVLSGLETDLELVQQKIEPSTLFTEDGSIIRGAQSRIAEALGIPNAGQTNRKRIKAILADLALSRNSTTARNVTFSRKVA